MSPSAWRCPKKEIKKTLMKPLAYKKNEMALTQKVTTQFVNSLGTSIACTAFSRSTAAFRFNYPSSYIIHHTSYTIKNGSRSQGPFHVKMRRD
jgi:hypothetical protein